MNKIFTLKFLQQKIGAEYIELNPVTGNPRIIQGLNEVWSAIDQCDGVLAVAEKFHLPEHVVWGWIDDHYIPERFAIHLAGQNVTVVEIQSPSLGYEDPESGACWPWTWRMTAIELDSFQYAR